MLSARDGRPAPFNLVIFDCDGVLIDSEIISCSSVVNVMARHGVDCTLPWVLNHYLGRPSSAVTDDYVRLSGKPLPPEFVGDWRTELFDRFTRDLTAIPGIRAAVEALSVPYCVASSSDGERIAFTLRKTALWDLFDGRVFSTTMVTHGKPAPDLFLLAAERMGMPPAQCLVVEDSVSGITAAKAAGMTAWGFTGGSHFSVVDRTQDLLAAGADRILTSITELPASLAGLEAQA
jgi:HAD superfamily hydrolase (TIGR01509 family)